MIGARTVVGQTLTLGKNVTLDVRSRAAVLADVSRIWKSGKAAGILKQQDKGVEFPYQSIRAEFTVKPSELRRAG